MEIENVLNKIIDNRYKIINILGQGSTGITYAALDLTTQAKVAVKAVSLRQLQDWKQLELLEREAKVLAQLNYPAIPKYLDYFHVDSEDERIFYIVQQLAPGKSLYQLIESGWRSTETEIKKIATQILEILSYIHSLAPPIIHRDIKPHNLIFSDDGKIFLVDFGAVQNTYYNTLMKGSTVVGTYGYMAPEQFKGKATPATDLYGLGATMLYLLTHRSPNELPQNALTIDFRSSVNISEGLAIWLEKTLQPDLESRFSSAAEALESLNSRHFFKNSLSNKSKVALNLGLVGAIAFGGIFGFNNYKWGILSRLGYQPSGLCDDSNTIKDYLETGGNLNIKLLVDPKYQPDNPKTETNLWGCIINNQGKEMVELMIAKGANVNARDRDDITPLHRAARNHQHEIAKLLISQGADVNAKDNNGATPLFSAMGHQEDGKETSLTDKLLTAELLIAKRANVNAKDNNGVTPLHQAASNHGREVAEFLISRGADINAKDNNGITPLSSAARNHNHEVAELLITKGVDINTKDNDGITPLLWAVNEAQYNSASELLTVKLLISKGADINAKDDSGQTALLKNSINQHTTKFLIAQGADVNAKAKNGITPLFKSLHNLDITKLIIKKGANVNARDNYGNTPLFGVIDNQGFSIECVQLLIDNGADVNARNKDGNTPLFYAVSRRDQDIVKLLINNGVEVNAKNKDGETVLFKAVADSNEEIMKLLIAGGVDVNAQNKQGMNPLFSAIRSKYHIDSTKVKLLVNNGANVNAKDKDGKTSLFSAINRMATDDNTAHEVAELLIDAGSDVNARDNNGKTPLFEAVYIYNPKAVELLIDHGADVNSRDKSGIAIFSFARDCGLTHKHAIGNGIVDLSSFGNCNNNHEDRKFIVDILTKNGAVE
jgi:ankyrin repeat protein